MNRALINLRKVDRMGVLAFENAIRLHDDSILLFKNHSYPSSFALSVLALEELGKYLHLEDFVWYSRIDGRFNPKEEEEIIRLIFDHKYKQRKFSIHLDLPMLVTKAIKNIYHGAIDKDKQNAFYVGLRKNKGKIDLKGKISTPAKITRTKAEDQITIVNDFIICLTAGVIKETYTVDIGS